MRNVDTGALSNVAPNLGIGNPASVVEQVVFDDGTLQQVRDTSRIRPFHIQDSWAGFNVQNAHTVAGNISGTFNPYTSQAPGADWPTVDQRRRMDCWLMTMRVTVSVAANFVAADVFGPFLGGAFFTYATFAGTSSLGFAVNATEVGSGKSTIHRPFRLPRTTLTLRSRAQTGAVDVDFGMGFLWLPIGMYQEAL